MLFIHALLGLAIVQPFKLHCDNPSNAAYLVIHTLLHLYLLMIDVIEFKRL